MKGDQESLLSLATGGFDHTIRMWQPSTGKYIQGFQHNESQVNALAFSKDGHYLAAAGYAKVRVYDTYGTVNPTVVVPEFSKNVNTVGFSEAGNWMFAGGEDKIAKIIDWRAAGNLCITRVHQAAACINSMVLHRNQHEIILATSKGDITIWDLRNNAASTICPEPQNVPIHSIALNSEVTSLAAVTSTGHLLVWSFTNETSCRLYEKHRCKVHPTYALKVEFSPDSTLVVTCGADGKFNVLKTADFTLTTSQKVNSSGHYWVWDCAFSADSHFLLTASSDNVARLWNLETGEMPIEYKGHQRAITCLAFRDQSLE